VFLSLVVNELGLKNVEVVCDRAEIYSRENKEKFDIATARAVSKLNILLEISSQMIKVGGYFIALKGRIAQEEIEQAKFALKLLNFKIEKNKEDRLPSEEDKRANIFIKKMGSTNQKYPRNYSQIKNRPL
jgi:16S rRNA (guanine527-N7)-methyltransferase